MNLFMTGATGYIGGAVAAALRSANHDVTALVRPDADTERLLELGVVLLGGDLEGLPSLRDQLAGFDAFIHTAQSKSNKVVGDRAAVDTFISLRGHLIYTSGVWVMGNTMNASESTPVKPLSIVDWRPAHEELVIAAGGAVLRPGCVYGGAQSLCADWFAAASQQRPARLVGNGRNRWAMVDLHELADLYLLSVDQQSTGILHGIDDTDATLDDCVQAVGAEVEHLSLETARAALGPFADALVLDQRISSAETRKATGWNPQRTFTNSVAAQWEEWKRAELAGN